MQDNCPSFILTTGKAKMSIHTPKDTDNLVIYSVYVRAHGPSGTFKDVENDLERIKGMGVDVVWFLPIHPIGKLKAKGSLGCPYSISDYRGVNPEYGTEEDLKRLIKKAHQLGLKVMIDVVYHHTSHDSNLITEHPEWYRQNADGTPQTSVPEWSDIIDLNHPNEELTQYLIDSLRKWVELGIDGFRCDVASCVPIEFWSKAIKKLREINPDLLWLAESVNPDFIRDRRAAGLIAHSDAELFEHFDILYDYDIWFAFKAVLAGKMSIERYLELMALQDAHFPHNFSKMRFVENHDQKRIMDAATSERHAFAWTAFQAFNKGPFLIYAGQESKDKRTPSLFEKEDVNWDQYQWQNRLTKLSFLKKHEIMLHGKFKILSSSPCLQAAWVEPSGQSLYGIFNVAGSSSQEIETQAPDGEYVDICSETGSHIVIKNGKTKLPADACIFRVNVRCSYKNHVPDFWTYN